MRILCLGAWNTQLWFQIKRRSGKRKGRKHSHLYYKHIVASPPPRCQDRSLYNRMRKTNRWLRSSYGKARVLASKIPSRSIIASIHQCCALERLSDFSASSTLKQRQSHSPEFAVGVNTQPLEPCGSSKHCVKMCCGYGQRGSGVGSEQPITELHKENNPQGCTAGYSLQNQKQK